MYIYFFIHYFAIFLLVAKWQSGKVAKLNVFGFHKKRDNISPLHYCLFEKFLVTLQSECKPRVIKIYFRLPKCNLSSQNLTLQINRL